MLFLKILEYSIKDLLGFYSDVIRVLLRFYSDDGGDGHSNSFSNAKALDSIKIAWRYYVTFFVSDSIKILIRFYLDFYVDSIRKRVGMATPHPFLMQKH